MNDVKLFIACAAIGSLCGPVWALGCSTGSAVGGTTSGAGGSSSSSSASTADSASASSTSSSSTSTGTSTSTSTGVTTTSSTSDASSSTGGAPDGGCGTFKPLTVDDAFTPKGWMGDVGGIQFVDCAIARPIPEAVGACHAITYAQPASGSMGWAGINWQHPADYWADPPEPYVGYPMPCGASKISFYAKGAKGGEVINFWGGNVAYQAKLDKVALTTEWVHYSMSFNGSPDDNVTLGFGWSMGAPPVDTPATFYIDDIKWE